MYSLVLFDLDGTLVDTAPDIADAVNDWLAAQSLPPASLDTVRDRIGHGTRELLVQSLAAASGVAPDSLRRDETIERMMESYFPHYLHHCGKRGRPFPGAVHCLKALRAADVRTVLLTNKERRATQPMLEVHGLDRLFDLTLCGDTLSARKPHPLPVLHALQAFNVPPSRAVFIGDSDIDVETAHNAGVEVWAVPHGYNHGRIPARADRQMPDLAAIREALLEGAAVPAPAGFIRGVEQAPP